MKTVILKSLMKPMFANTVLRKNVNVLNLMFVPILEQKDKFDEAIITIEVTVDSMENG